MAPNREGVSSISATSLRVPSNKALEFWLKRFDDYGVKHGEISERAGRLTLEFRDFETQRFFLVSDENDNGVKSSSNRICDYRTWARTINCTPHRIDYSRINRFAGISLKK